MFEVAVRQRFPYDYFIKYLLVMGGKNSDIDQVLINLKLPTPPETHLETLSHEIGPPPKSGKGKKAKEWVKQTGVFSLWAKEQAAMAALEIVKYMDLRHFLHGVLPTRGVEKSGQLVKQHLKVEIPLPVLKEYVYYFWNVEQMGYADWRNFIALSDREERLNLEISAFGGEQHYLWARGERVRMENREMLEIMRDDCFFKHREMILAPNTRNNAIVAQMWREGFFDAVEQLEANEYSLAAVMEEFRKFQLRPNKRVIPTWQEVIDVTRNVPQIEEQSSGATIRIDPVRAPGATNTSPAIKNR